MSDNKTIVTLKRTFTQVSMSEEGRETAISAAYWVTCSPHEHEWTKEQQVAMAQYVLWAAQRLEAIKGISAGAPLLHED